MFSDYRNPYSINKMLQVEWENSTDKTQTLKIHINIE